MVCGRWNTSWYRWGPAEEKLAEKYPAMARHHLPKNPLSSGPANTSEVPGTSWQLTWSTPPQDQPHTDVNRTTNTLQVGRAADLLSRDEGEHAKETAPAEGAGGEPVGDSDEF